MSAVERADLERFMVADFGYVNPATDPIPVITDIGFADRALRKIAEAERRKARATNYAAEEIAKVGRWRDAIVSSADADVAYWKQSLEAWHRAVLRDDPEAKTQKLPHGTVRLRALPPKVMVEGDPDEQAPAELVSVKRSWSKTAISKRTSIGPEIPLDEADGPIPEGTRVHRAVTADGEVVPQVTYWVTDEPSFSVTVEP